MCLLRFGLRLIRPWLVRRRPPDATDANIFTEVGDLPNVDEEDPNDFTEDAAVNEVELEISGSDHDSCTGPPKCLKDKEYEEAFCDKLETLVTGNLSNLAEVWANCCADSRCVGVRAWRTFPAVGAICLRLVVWTSCG